MIVVNILCYLIHCGSSDCVGMVFQVIGLEATKLIPNLLPKQRYILHYRNLQQYVALGVEVPDVHRILSFRQEPWMRSYIEKNTELRKMATSDFEKDFFKLMNNSVYGKTMENVRKRINLRVLRANEEEKKIQRRINKPSYIRSVVFDNDLVSVECSREKVTLTKPVYVGATILDLSKSY
eukprot:scpid45046/ scgid5239/ 